MKYLKFLSLGLAVAMFFAACSYQTIADADYPEQQVYIAAATSGGVYAIETVPSHTSNTPTAGTPFRFTVDRQKNLFTIPLSIYRSGIDNKGAVEVQIQFDSDTVRSLIGSGALADVEELPAQIVKMSSSVSVRSGESTGEFAVDLPLDYLLDNAPDKQFAFALTISEADRKINTKFSTLVVMIDTRIMEPTSDFSFQADADAWDRIVFKNTSTNIVASHWDFGDNTSSDQTNATHTYQQEGTYQVTLTTTGVSGEQKTKTIAIPVLHIEKIDRTGWSIVDFSTEEPAEGNGNGLAINVLDGKLDTFWHTQWAGASPGYPHFLVIDMGQTYTIANVQCVRRQGDDRGQTECQLFLSLDGESWNDCGKYSIAASDAPQTFTMPSYQKARYIKYVATKGNQNFAFLAELMAYGSKE